MSEAELHVLQGRLRAGQLNKARRGEYFTHAPIREQIIAMKRDGITPFRSQSSPSQ